MDTHRTRAGFDWSHMIRLPASCCLAVLLGVALRSGAAAQAAGGSPAPAPTLVPRPVHVTPKPGSFALTGATVITTDAATRALGAMLADYLFPATGLRLGVRSTAPAGAAGISIRLDKTLVPRCGRPSAGGSPVGRRDPRGPAGGRVLREPNATLTLMALRDRLIELRDAIRPAAAARGARDVRVFGSVARAEEARDT
jgi:hypothetical protein